MGLDVVFTMAQKVGGTVRVDSQRGQGTVFHLQLPLTLSVLRTLLVDIAGEPYALPLPASTAFWRLRKQSWDRLKTASSACLRANRSASLTRRRF